MDILLLLLPLEKTKFVLKFPPQFVLSTVHNNNEYIQQYNRFGQSNTMNNVSQSNKYS